MFDIEEWKGLEDTREFLRTLEARITEIEQDIGRNQRTLTFDSLNSTALRTAYEAGRIASLVEILDDYK
jgi:hypothetical protein